MRFCYVTLVWVVAIGCGSAEPQVSAPATQGEPSDAGLSHAPATSAQRPSSMDAEPEVPTHYAIEDTDVLPEVFEAFLAELDVAEEPSMSEEVVNPDGSYGGHAASYPAVHRSTRDRYLYSEANFVFQTGERTRTRMIRRESAVP